MVVCLIFFWYFKPFSSICSVQLQICSSLVLNKFGRKTRELLTVSLITVYNIQCVPCITDLMHGSTLMITNFHLIAHGISLHDACRGLFKWKVHVTFNWLIIGPINVHFTSVYSSQLYFHKIYQWAVAHLSQVAILQLVFFLVFFGVVLLIT